MIRMDEMVPMGTRGWWVLLAAALVGRTCDLGSTFVGTPHLILEGNPIAKRLGWRWGIPLNAIICVVAASWPLLCISLTTSSLLVSARNLQSVWLMRTLGEMQYRNWMADRMADANPRTLLACYWGEAGLSGVVGLGILLFSPMENVSFAIGFGVVVYSILLVFFTTLGFIRNRW